MSNNFIYIILPLVLTNVLHMVIIKRNLYPWLNKPISLALFGSNKTWRGFVLVPILNAFFLFLLCVFSLFFSIPNSLAFGALMGFTYVLFELPNSWLKRRIGIGSGEKAPKLPWLFMILDKTDSAFGISLVGAFILSLNFLETLQLFALSVFTHVFFSVFLVLIRVKKRF